MTGYQFLEVFKGFGRRTVQSYQAHRKTKPAEIPAGFVSFYGGGCFELTLILQLNILIEEY